MAYTMYNNNSSKRGYFYDVRNLPYNYYGMHPMEVVEYQRGRPAKLPLRSLNRQFKATTIELNNQQQQQQQGPLTISVQTSKVGKQQQQQPCLVLSKTTDDEAAAVTTGEVDCKTAGGTLCVPESPAIHLIQQLRKLAKWKPTASGGLPSSGQGLSFEDAVFKAQVVNLAVAAGSDESQEAPPPRQLAIKILAESRAKDPQERKELASVLVPMEPGCLDKLRTALSNLVVTESPLYHTESQQVSDGSKIYLDLIKDATAHYLKISQVTRDFRSIVSVPASDVEGLLDVLSTSLKAIKEQDPQLQQKKQPQLQPGSAEGAPGKSSAAGKRKRGRNPRRRPGAAGSTSNTNRRRRRDDAADTAATAGGAATSTSAASAEDDEAAAGAASGEAKTSGSQSSDNEKENVAAAAPKSEDNLTVESRPVENGDGCSKCTTAE